MRPPSARVLRNRVTKTVITWTTDAAGGRVPGPGAPSDPLPCSVQPASAKSVPDHLRQQGVAYYDVLFPADPAVKVRDLLTWVDGGNKTLVVWGIALDQAGRGSTWLVTCEHRPVTL